MNQRVNGFFLSLFFSFLGLLGLLSCSDAEEKNKFMAGWWTAFIVVLVIVIASVVYLFTVQYEELMSFIESYTKNAK